MDNGAQELSEDDANDIADALLALRENRSLCGIMNALTPLVLKAQSLDSIMRGDG